MRVSDSMRYRLLQANINKVAQQLDSIQTKIATQKEINAPSDDPIKYATSIQYTAERSIGSQYNDTLTRLNTFVSMYDAVLSSASSELNNLTDLINTYSTMDSSMRTAAAIQINSIIEDLVTVGNSKIGNMYIFGGQQADSAPFQLNSDYSVTCNVSQEAEDATSIYVDRGQLGQFGISGRQAFFGTEKVVFGAVSNSYSGDIYSNSENFSYLIDDEHNTINVTINVDGGDVMLDAKLTNGVYTGAGLAKEIQTQLNDPNGSGVSTDNFVVAFDSTTRKFLITNNSGGDATFDWSASKSKAASVLGYSNGVEVVASGQIEKSDYDTGRKSFLVQIAGDGTTTGELSSRATYKCSTDGGLTWVENLTVNTGGADATADITIDDSNHTIVVNGETITIENGVFTGEELASSIATALGATDFAVTYSGDTRKFTITNGKPSTVTINWSDSTLGGVLGFETATSVLSSGSSDTSDYVAGMFIDGSGVANATNNGIKLVFGTTGTLSEGETFQVKDLSVFELLKNFKDAIDDGDDTWISQNAGLLDKAVDLINKNNAVIAFQGTQANTLISNNKTKDAQLDSMQSNLTDANINELAIQYNTLLTTYQSLLATLAKMQNVSILDYL